MQVGDANIDLLLEKNRMATFIIRSKMYQAKKLCVDGNTFVIPAKGTDLTVSFARLPKNIDDLRKAKAITVEEVTQDNVPSNEGHDHIMER